MISVAYQPLPALQWVPRTPLGTTTSASPQWRKSESSSGWTRWRIQCQSRPHAYLGAKPFRPESRKTALKSKRPSPARWQLSQINYIRRMSSLRLRFDSARRKSVIDYYLSEFATNFENGVGVDACCFSRSVLSGRPSCHPRGAGPGRSTNSRCRYRLCGVCKNSPKRDRRSRDGSGLYRRVRQKLEM